VGSMLGLPVIGVISHRVDNRYLLSAGFFVFGLCAVYFSFVDLEIGPSTLLWPIVLTGFALSFVFVPIATMATSMLRDEQIGNATCVFNLLRNIGGSIGISMAQTFLVRRTNFHEAQLAADLPQSGARLQEQVQAASVYLGRELGPASGHRAALGLTYRQLEQQALLLSFMDVFRWTALAVFASAAMVWLFRKAEKLPGADRPPLGH
jgi:DHA2 family multidrug resistance protein